MPKKKPQVSVRAARRAGERASEKLADAGAKLARLEAGGSPDHPIELESASLVELTATGIPCARCGGPLRVDDHAAEKINGTLMRVVHTHCHRCGSLRVLYMRILSALPN
ncbi:MAG: hypothetical protein ABI461_09900 [Polyangiaceae bacterium]